MARRIDYFFSVASPWAYIGYAPFMDIVAQHGATVAYKPVALGQVFEETGGLPLPKRHPARQRYRLVELQRWRERRGLRFNLQPKYWPFDPALADGTVIAVLASRKDPERFLRLAHAAVWEGDRDLADEATVADLLSQAGLDPAPLMAAARSAETEAARARNLADALSTGVVGAPSYVVEGEVFWGQDRLDLLDDMLRSGRPAYGPV